MLRNLFSYTPELKFLPLDKFREWIIKPAFLSHLYILRVNEVFHYSLFHIISIFSYAVQFNLACNCTS